MPEVIVAKTAGKTRWIYALILSAFEVFQSTRSTHKSKWSEASSVAAATRQDGAGSAGLFCVCLLLSLFSKHLLSVALGRSWGIMIYLLRKDPQKDLNSRY